MSPAKLASVLWKGNWGNHNIAVGSGNGLVPSANKPLPEPMLTHMFVTMWCHQGPGHNELSALGDIWKIGLSFYCKELQFGKHKLYSFIKIEAYKFDTSHSKASCVYPSIQDAIKVKNQ